MQLLKYLSQCVGNLGTIDYAAKNGLKFFDFMGAGASDKDYGVRKFKSQFGGKLVEYGRFLRVYNKFLYSLGKIGLWVYQKVI